VAQIRERWPRVAIVVRSDSGFCREDLMRWCEEQHVDYVLGLARNQRRLRRIGPEMYERGGSASKAGGRRAFSPPSTTASAGAAGDALSPRPSTSPAKKIRASGKGVARLEVVVQANNRRPLEGATHQGGKAVRVWVRGRAGAQLGLRLFRDGLILQRAERHRRHHVRVENVVHLK